MAASAGELTDCGRWVLGGGPRGPKLFLGVDVLIGVRLKNPDRGGWCRAWVPLLVVLACLLYGGGAGVARASFAGRDGLLAMVPLTGSGVVVAEPNGTHARRVCGSRTCGRAEDLVWSADGQKLALALRPAGNYGMFSVTDAQGDCIVCQQFFFPVQGPGAVAFLPDSELVRVDNQADFATAPGELVLGGFDGLGNRRLVGGGDQSPAVSSTGQLAFVRATSKGPMVYLAGVGGRDPRRMLGSSTSPDFAPSGDALVVVHHGWVTTVSRTGRIIYRLVRGSDPAWSPSGRRIAFVTPSQRIATIAPDGRHLRTLKLRGTAVNWQPQPTQRPRCAPPVGSQTVIDTPTTILTDHNINEPPDTFHDAYFVCSPASGRERLMAFTGYDGGSVGTSAGKFTAAGDYIGYLITADSRYYGESANVTRYDIQTGATTTVGSLPDSIDQDYSLTTLLLAPNSNMAWLASEARPIDTSHVTSTAQIQAHDSLGTRILDQQTITGTRPLPSGLANLQLDGNQLSWTHSGDPRTATLH